MKLKKLAILVFVGVTALSGLRSWANGGAWMTGVSSTGNAAASDQGYSTEVTIEEENLTIDLHQEYAAVEVHYRMRNTGSRVKQDFFFPVEKWETDLNDYRISADGKELKWENLGGLSEREAKEAAKKGMFHRDAIKSWKKSRIPFSSGQTQEVVIHFNAPYGRESSEISDNCYIGAAIFAYSLSPAATWKGTIQKGKVVINILHPEPQDVLINAPKERFAKVNETRYEWNFQDLKPTLADDLKITAHRSYQSFPVSHAVGSRNSEFPGEYVLYDDRYYLVHVAYDAVASSTLKPDGAINYDVKNIKERFSRKQTWSEGVEGDGIGESITMDVKRPLPLDAILINPGYGAEKGGGIYGGMIYGDTSKEGDDFWWKNNRVAQLKITLNGKYTFTAAIPDEVFHDPYPILVRGYSEPVSKIKLVIKGVYRGTAYQDTCISLVELRATLSKKPKQGPCR